LTSVSSNDDDIRLCRRRFPKQSEVLPYDRGVYARAKVVHRAVSLGASAKVVEQFFFLLFTKVRFETRKLILCACLFPKLDVFGRELLLLGDFLKRVYGTAWGGTSALSLSVSLALSLFRTRFDAREEHGTVLRLLADLRVDGAFSVSSVVYTNSADEICLHRQQNTNEHGSISQSLSIDRDTEKSFDHPTHAIDEFSRSLVIIFRSL
jgi:hypothetical protein